ncbi:chitin deacetylase, partial [Asbolus verrucosus]
HPASLEKADKCDKEQCTIGNNCRCSSSTSPLAEGDAPQVIRIEFLSSNSSLIALTIDEAVTNDSFVNLWQPLLFDRKNPDGNPITATFFVSHEYTDYSRVQELYVRGFEIGDNSITKSSLSEYWKNATEDTLKQEFGGQRTIISHFANIPDGDIVGVRTPQLQIEGDISINAYVASGLQYDSSWTSRSTSLLFPYTLDYLSSQECRTGTTCPTESHPGFWVAPIINIQGKNNIECNSLVTCFYDGTADEIAAWLLSQVERVRNSNRAPMTLMLSSAYFRSVDNSVEGFQKFLDGLGSDVFLVSVKEIIEWVKNPVTVDLFKTATPERTANCNNPTNCLLTNADGNVRYMVSCVQCPEVYPWLGNPLGLIDPDQTTTTTPKPTTTSSTTTTPATTTAA